MTTATAMAIGDTFTTINAFTDLLFLIVYTVRAEWWHSRVATNLFIFLACLDAVWFVSAWHHLTGEVVVYTWIRAALFAAFVPITLWRLGEMLRAQAAQRRRDAARRPAPDPVGDECAG
jgi:hypothetical protein